jgi:hypothetical protein
MAQDDSPEGRRSNVCRVIRIAIILCAQSQAYSSFIRLRSILELATLKCLLIAGRAAYAQLGSLGPALSSAYADRITACRTPSVWASRRLSSYAVNPRCCLGHSYDNDIGSSFACTAIRHVVS